MSSPSWDRQDSRTSRNPWFYPQISVAITASSAASAVLPASPIILQMVRDLVRAVRRQWVAAAAAFAASAILGWIFVPGAPATFRAEAVVVLRESPFPSSPDFPLAPASPPPGPAAEAFRSDRVLERAVRSDLSGYTSSDPPERLAASVADLRSRLRVRSGPGSGVYTVSCTAGGPGRAAALANGVALAFEKDSGDRRRDEIERALHEVDQALGGKARTEAEAAAALRALPGGGPETAAERQAELERAQAAGRAESEALAGRIEELAGRIERGDAGPPRTVSTAESDRLGAELDRALRELEDLRAARPPDWPPTLRLERRVEDLRERRAEAASRELLEARFAPLRALLDEARALAARREALARDFLQREAELQALRPGAAAADPGRRRELEARVRALGESRGGLETLRARLAREKDLAGSLVERIDAARGAVAVSTPLAWILAASTLLGLAAAWLRERLAATIRTEYDVRRHVNLPLLGILPRVRREEDRAPASADPRSPLTEGFVALAALFERRAREGSAKCFAVASPGPGEGKSSVACGLGAALARAGRRVLLVDADLRRPSLHRLLVVPGETGLSSFLSGAAESPDAVMVATAVENLTLLPAGPLPESPAAYLRSERFRGMLAALREAYDYVIVDLPPVGAAADALLAAPLADGTLLVFSALLTRKDEVASAKRALRGAGAKLAGCVLNAAALESRGYYTYSAETVEADA